MHEPQPITVRRMPFEFPDALDPVVFEGAQRHFLGWVHRVCHYMLAVGPADNSKSTPSSGLFGTLRAQFGPILRTYLPNDSPHDNVYSPKIRAITERYTAMATSTR